MWLWILFLVNGVELFQGSTGLWKTKMSLWIRHSLWYSLPHRIFKGNIPVNPIHIHYKVPLTYFQNNNKEVIIVYLLYQNRKLSIFRQKFFVNFSQTKSGSLLLCMQGLSLMESKVWRTEYNSMLACNVKHYYFINFST